MQRMYWARVHEYIKLSGFNKKLNRMGTPSARDFNRLLVVPRSVLQQMPKDLACHFSDLPRNTSVWMHSDSAIPARAPKTILLTIGHVSFEAYETAPLFGDPRRKDFDDAIQLAQDHPLVQRYYPDGLWVDPVTGLERKLRAGDMIEIPVGSNEDLDDLFGEEVYDKRNDADEEEDEHSFTVRDPLEEAVRDADGWMEEPELANECPSYLSFLYLVHRWDDWASANRLHPEIAALDDLGLHKWILAKASANLGARMEPEWVARHRIVPSPTKPGRMRHVYADPFTVARNQRSLSA